MRLRRYRTEKIVKLRRYVHHKRNVDALVHLVPTEPETR